MPRFCFPSDFVYVYQAIYPSDGEREAHTKSDVVLLEELDQL